MTTVHRWTGRETRALRQALRMSIKDFSAHLGVAERTVSKWEAGQDNVRPRPEMQAALDTALGTAAEDVRDRFILALDTLDQRPSPQPLGGLAGLTAVYPSRSQLSAHLPADQLFDGARDIRAVGLSLNMLCQDYADRRWQALLSSGTQVRCLFLDPAGPAIQAREAEEGFPAGQLSALTKLNIETLLRVRDRLPASVRDGMNLATYDETLRFNIVLVDDLCVAQPYLAESRGVDSPAFVIRRDLPGAGLYPVFEQVFESQWQRGRAL
ncbi:helix-turn-helix transcriptional regulator [Micromonospora sp. ATA32]|nr:helix-turn-helix transcriptional regulator [Micromonospora sp. ATA32]